MSSDGIAHFTLLINEEQIKGNGEDSLLSYANSPNAALIACMDGCGGSGAQRYSKAGNVSGARLASKHVCNVLRYWLQVSQIGFEKSGTKGPQELATEIKNTIDEELSQLNARVSEVNTGVVSRLAKSFPTTLAAMLTEVIGYNKLRCIAFWAGDSRAYLFKASGLQQISTDDVRGGGDPLFTLERDGILSNVISATSNYKIHAIETFVDEPCMVLTATDGCFSYLRSPIEFEGILLESLLESNSPQEWEDALRIILGHCSSDDYSMAISVLGFQNWNAVKNAYAPRREDYMRRFGEPLEGALLHANHQAHYELWETYKEKYLYKDERSQ